VYDILYIVKQFGPETELQSRLREVDVSAACAAAGKYKVLVAPLTYLGVFGLTDIPVEKGGDEKLREDCGKKLAL